MDKTRLPKTKKRPSQAAKKKARPRNRYMRGAKLSEYKFLKILRAFANGLSPKDAAAETGISEKTIRATYAALRRKVMEAAKSGKPIFGMGSRYLYENGRLTEKGSIFLEAVSKSRVMESYLADHAPRLKDEAERETYVFDLAMRILTGLVVAEDEFYELSPDLKRSLARLELLRVWIDQHKDEPGFVEEHRETIERHARLSRMAALVQEQRQIIKLRRSRKHSYMGSQYFRELVGFVIKSPIFSATRP